jgi:hypothetical protein
MWKSSGPCESSLLPALIASTCQFSPHCFCTETVISHFSSLRPLPQQRRSRHSHAREPRPRRLTRRWLRSSLSASSHSPPPKSADRGRETKQLRCWCFHAAWADHQIKTNLRKPKPLGDFLREVWHNISRAESFSHLPVLGGHPPAWQTSRARLPSWSTCMASADFGPSNLGG